MGHPSDRIPQEPFNYQTWKISPKGFDKDVQKFDGKPESYRHWRGRVRDHLISGHQPWARLLDLIEKHRHQLTFRWLGEVTSVDGAQLGHASHADAFESSPCSGGYF